MWRFRNNQRCHSRHDFSIASLMSSRTCFEICTLETITTNENISGRTTQQRTECTFLLSAHRSMQLLFMKDQGRLFTALSVSQRAPSGSQNRNAETSMTRLDVFRKPAGMLKQVHDVTYSQSQHCHPELVSGSLRSNRRTGFLSMVKLLKWTWTRSVHRPAGFCS